MNERYLSKVPKWYKEINKDDSLILTADMDGICCAAFLQNLFGCKISTFFDSKFRNSYKTTDVIQKSKPTIGVDLSLTGTQRTFSNHCIRLNEHFKTNPNDINLNNLFNVYSNDEQYHKKYSGSTFLMLLSLYHIDLSNLSEEAKLLILCIDSSYKSFYSEYPRDNKACKFFLCDVLELTELYKTLERHTKEDLEDIKEKYNLNSNIYVDENGQLKTEANLFLISMVLGVDIFGWIELPKDTFILEKTYHTGFGAANVVYSLLLKGKHIISLACTSKFYCNFSFE